ncbi:hypothetical protein G8T75_12790 [Clostridium botulinum D/C]|uniref:hypothetical protein n=1 Tax=Clostridium botulinum TaxID=1491 RepID=UPI001E313221|nr:hypothetical protein [Clostridium botulinum]MCD3240834.1 hypothetical protein [Clostridium botulinum D/C]
MTLVEEFQAKEGNWSKYTHLDFFDRCSECNKEANKVDLTKVNIQAGGQALIMEIENMCCFPIVAEENFLKIWEHNGWTMQKWLQQHKERIGNKHYNPLQVVSCRN